MIDGEMHRFTDREQISELGLSKTHRHTIDVVLDRFTIISAERVRVQEAIEKSFRLAGGFCKISYLNEKKNSMKSFFLLTASVYTVVRHFLSLSRAYSHLIRHLVLVKHVMDLALLPVGEKMKIGIVAGRVPAVNVNVMRVRASAYALRPVR